MPPLALGLITDPILRENFLTQLSDYVFKWDLGLKGAIATAADLRPAVILVDLDDQQSDWLNITLALRTNPATRRIPLIGICEHYTDALQKLAQSVHFEAVIERAQIDKIAEIVQPHARLWGADYYDALQSICEEPLPQYAAKGLALFNAREFWEAHEALEHAWMEETRPVREMYRAILQVGVAYHHIQKANYRGALKMFLRAVQWLDPLPDTCQGIDLAQFKRDAAAARAALERLTPETINQFDQSLLKPVPMILP